MYQQIGKPMQGGMGIVSHLYHLSWQIDVAMKQPKVFNNLYLSECEKWIHLGIHPNIVQCFYIQNTNNMPCIISEWMNDGNLREYIYQNHVNLEKVIDIALQIANGLAYAHKNKILHLDIKPENVLFNGKYVKITDFGISTYFHENPTNYMTLNYCSPEQLIQMNVDETSDVYSWALCVLFMLIGDDDWIDSINAGKHIDDYLKKSRFEIPTSLQEILISCLNQDCTKRPKHMYLIASKLNMIYRQLTNTFYPHEHLLNYKTNDLDSKNNHAVSQILLGNHQQAKQMFKDILKINPNHMYTKYNYRYCFDWYYQDYPNRLMNYKELPSELQYRFLTSINAYHEAYKLSNSNEYLKLFETKGAVIQKKYNKKVDNCRYFFATHKEGNFIYINDEGTINGVETPLKNPCCAAKSKDDRYIAIAQNINFLGFTYQVLVYELESMILVYNYKAKTGQIKSMIFTSSNQLLILTSEGILLYVPQQDKAYPFESNDAYLKINHLYLLPNQHFAGFTDIHQNEWTCIVFDPKLKPIHQFAHYQPNVCIKIHPTLPYALMSTPDGGYEVYDLMKRSLISMDKQLGLSTFDIVEEHIYCLSDQIIQRRLPDDFTCKPAFLILQSYTTEQIISNEQHQRLLIERLKQQKASLDELLQLKEHSDYVYYTHYLLGRYDLKGMKLHKKVSKTYINEKKVRQQNPYISTIIKNNAVTFVSHSNQLLASIVLNEAVYSYGYSDDLSQFILKRDEYLYDIYDIEWIYQ